jgi:hypothetical protein
LSSRRGTPDCSGGSSLVIFDYDLGLEYFAVIGNAECSATGKLVREIDSEAKIMWYFDKQKKEAPLVSGGEER